MLPDEKRALAAVQRVQALEADELDRRITEEIGNPLLGMFGALAKSISDDESARATAERVHLMVLAFLIRGELGTNQG